MEREGEGERERERREGERTGGEGERDLPRGFHAVQTSSLGMSHNQTPRLLLPAPVTAIGSSGRQLSADVGPCDWPSWAVVVVNNCPEPSAVPRPPGSFTTRCGLLFVLHVHFCCRPFRGDSSSHWNRGQLWDPNQQPSRPGTPTSVLTQTVLTVFLFFCNSRKSFSGGEGD